MSSILGFSAIGIGALSLWPLSLFIRRWWFKPYRNPKRVLRSIQRSLRLSRSEIRHIQAMHSPCLDPIAAVQFLLDPCRWPTAAQDETTKKLFAKVFRQLQA